jgi:hypothetical protein
MIRDPYVRLDRLIVENVWIVERVQTGIMVESGPADWLIR